MLSNYTCLDHRPGEVIHAGDEEVASDHITHTVFKTTNPFTAFWQHPYLSPFLSLQSTVKDEKCHLFLIWRMFSFFYKSLFRWNFCCLAKITQDMSQSRVNVAVGIFTFSFYIALTTLLLLLHNKLSDLPMLPICHKDGTLGIESHVCAKCFLIMHFF